MMLFMAKSSVFTESNADRQVWFRAGQNELR